MIGIEVNDSSVPTWICTSRHFKTK